MQNELYEEKSIEIGLLDLDFYNPRFIDLFDKNSEEHEIIDHLLSKEKAKEIVEEIDNVQHYYADSKLWVIAKNGRYSVKEGNRRLAAVKALADPNRYLKGKYNKFEIGELPCLVYKNEDDVDSRVIRKHTQNEIETWSRLAQASYVKRFLDGGGDMKSLNIKNHKSLLKLYLFYEKAKSLGLGKALRNLLEDGKAAIIERFFGSSKITSQLGFVFTEHGIRVDEAVFKKTISFFIDWLSTDKEVTAHKINKNTIQAYIDERFALNGYKPTLKQLPLSDEKDEEKYKNHCGVVSLNEEPTITIETEQNIDNKFDDPKPTFEQPIMEVKTKRKKFIQKTSLLKDLFPTLGLDIVAYKKLLKEIQSLDFNSYPNAASALLRSFLDCTFDLFLESQAYNGTTLASAVKAFSSDSKLSTKMNTFKEWIQGNKNIVSIISAISNEIQYANCVIHMPNFDASPCEVIRFEERITPFLNFLYNEDGSSIKKPGSK